MDLSGRPVADLGGQAVAGHGRRALGSAQVWMGLIVGRRLPEPGR
ncbi:hypothetical protein [Streptomyces sp. NPDC050287]